jgi:ATP-dependent DNA helicase RecG
MSEKMSEKNTNVERTIERDLAKLKKLGILTRKGGRKNGEWVIVYSPQIESETENQ